MKNSKRISKKKIEVLVYVEGGNVQSIMVSNPSAVKVEIFDVDNLKCEGKTGKQIDSMWDKKGENLIPI